ncbi:rhomboid family intramembrane serine protease [Ovoidimarina sediminis]|uniref:rhomboid family intramembrane serine protease n=1 Tax=Ovoidimarina sediminis TaxID=3079856 RepID=UPI0029073D08|nr:rhomboid family intramembrane serine protease [Rhodophyticola sp. MJ-SS7]MDU8942579.1 rhomboid family intramembrane serine protease [Rhodophyticola sp. MJ-SS7]
MDPQTPTPSSGLRVSPAALCILVICVAVELTLQLADLGLLDIRRLRLRCYEYGGFWPGLLDDWRPNYAAQPWLMFLTYGFLHTGLAHLVVNMITLVSLGRGVSQRGGERGFLIVYVGSILGGALGYLFLASSPQPMVGASGALFGLAGALLAWEFLDRRRARERLTPVYALVALLAVLNVVLWWAMGGQMAWQTHLGGGLAGGAIALILARKEAPSD